MDDLPSHVRQVAAIMGHPVTREEANAIADAIRNEPGSLEDRVRDHLVALAKPPVLRIATMQEGER